MAEGVFLKKLISRQDGEKITVVCLGDSVTEGCFGHGIIDKEKCYVTKLGNMLRALFPKIDFEIINAGIGGTDARFGLERLQRDVISFSPDLVTVMFGVNDFADPPVYRASLDGIFKKLSSLGISCIYITEHMMNTRYSEKATEDYRGYAQTTAEAQNNGTMDEIFASGIASAKENGIPVCDIYSLWKKLNSLGVDTTDLLDNGINHPKAEMHDFIVHRLISVIFDGSL